MLNLLGLVSGFRRSIGLGRMWVLGLGWGCLGCHAVEFLWGTSLDNFPWLGCYEFVWF